MVELWRVVNARYRDTIFTGAGGMNVASRWLPAGHAVFYAAQSIALALLELSVHDRFMSSEDFVYAAIDVHDDVGIDKLNRLDLPHNWRAATPGNRCHSIGASWLSAGRTAILEVPSAVVPEESNFIVNVEHADFRKLIFGEIRFLAVDPRLRR